MSWEDPASKNKETPPPAPADAAGTRPEFPDTPSWEAPALQAMLGKLQGNIVKGHGRDHVRLVFLKFTTPPAQAKAAIRAFLALGHVQSAAEQRDHQKRFSKFGVPGPLFANLLLTAEGYRALGFTDLSGFVEDGPDLPQLRTAEVTFAKGAKDQSVVTTLSDPPVQTWEKGYREAIHSLVILADDHEGNLALALNNTIRSFENAAEVLLVESGDALRNEQGDTIEHFGYIDGRSQPLFFAEDIQKEITVLDGEDPTLVGPTVYLKFDPRANLDLVLTPDPMAPGGDNFGSYFVFRKLEQNVRAFKQQEQALADALHLEGDDRELAGAYTVGRFEDGTPTAMRNRPGLREPIPNNFNYSTDAEAQKCPFHAHIRKMNPRGDIVRTFASQPGQDPVQLDREERRRRIARRGITYGKRTADPADVANIPRLPTSDVGLLFMCFQSNIPTQFAFLQQSWANNEGFIKAGVGLDPLIGQQRDLDKPIAQKCPLAWGEPGSVRFEFSGFITLKGGEFFFAPSITFLQGL